MWPALKTVWLSPLVCSRIHTHTPTTRTHIETQIGMLSQTHTRAHFIITVRVGLHIPSQKPSRPEPSIQSCLLTEAWPLLSSLPDGSTQTASRASTCPPACCHTHCVGCPSSQHTNSRAFGCSPTCSTSAAPLNLRSPFPPSPDDPATRHGPVPSRLGREDMGLMLRGGGWGRTPSRQYYQPL